MAAPQPSQAHRPEARNESRRVLVLLTLGAAAGLMLAAIGLLRSDDLAAGLPDDAVAVVNGVAIRTQAYQRALNALAADRRSPIGLEEERHVLNRLLDEELLVQRGIELGLARHDRRVRGDLVAAVIESIVSAVELLDPSDEELESFYEANQGFFGRAGRLRVRRVVVRTGSLRTVEEARERADQVVRALRDGEDFASVAERLGDPPMVPVPEVLLPPTKLREYLGPTLTLAALELGPGEVSEPNSSPSGFSVLQMLDRTPESVPPFEEIRDQVRVEFRRRAGDRALREYLDRLRSSADLRVVESLR